MTEYKDWRGTPINIGDICIYGAPVGRSIAMVQAIVDGFTESGRVWLKVKHRSYGGGWSDSKNRVHVGADRLTIVLALPPTELPDEDEKTIESLKKSIQWKEELLDEISRGEKSAIKDGFDRHAYYLKEVIKDKKKLDKLTGVV